MSMRQDFGSARRIAVGMRLCVRPVGQTHGSAPTPSRITHPPVFSHLTPALVRGILAFVIEKDFQLENTA
jgi:hypothetical protein